MKFVLSYGGNWNIQPVEVIKYGLTNVIKYSKKNRLLDVDNS